MRVPTSAALLTAVLLLPACSDATADRSASPAGDPVQVTVGFYPYEFVASRVGGDDATVVNLTEPGAEPHDLELSPRQVAAVGESDLVVYSKGFQPAVDEAVEQQAADRALDVLTAVELRESAEHEGEEPAGEEHADEGADPHVWLDPVRLATIAGAVADELAERAPAKAEGFRARAAELKAELTALDAELRSGLDSCARTQVVTSHDAFGYLTEAYGLEQVALSGLSPDADPSPNRLAEIAALAKASGVTTVFFEELVSPKVAQSLAREVGARATVLSPLEGAPETGDYLSAMRTNLTVLRTALDCR